MLQPFHKNTLSSSHVSFPVPAHFSSTEGSHLWVTSTVIPCFAFHCLLINCN